MLKRIMILFFTFLAVALFVALVWVGPHIAPLLWAYPESVTYRERLKMFPARAPGLQERLKGPVSIRWNSHSVPFIHVDHDEDAAFALGLVHAHLRLGQMELARRISQGRVSEMIGPFGEKLDITLRTIDFGRAVPKILEAMPHDSRVWLARFVEGVNFAQENLMREKTGLPLEFKALRMRLSPWTERDILMIGRLAGSDLSWMTYVQFLKLKRMAGWEKIWKAFLDLGAFSTPSFSASNPDMFSFLIPRSSRSGSNSLAIAGAKTKSGSALIANDPHLGIYAPNVWLLAGVKSRSYQMVGMMLPGLPFMALGRNPTIAWGGTNMRSISSHLYRLTPEQMVHARVREERIRVRGWAEKIVRIRETEFGPIISDAPFFESDEPLALQWVGHQVSDELTAFLRANRARNFREFRNAFETYAISAQNILYADKDGHIGQLLAYRQPVVKDPSRQLDLVKDLSLFAEKFLKPTQLPSIENPREGVLASANNRPVLTDVPLAFRFSSNDRVERLRELALEHRKLDVENLMRIQLDTFSSSSFRLKSSVVEKVGDLQNMIVGDDDAVQAMWRTFSDFDGRYESGGRGPVAFEILMRHLADRLLIEEDVTRELAEFLIDGDDWKGFLLERLEKLAPDVLRAHVVSALRAGAYGFAEIADWGRMHRQVFGHPFASLPIVGSRFDLREYGASGSNDTINKSGHRFSSESGHVTYGACARQISDLSDPDANWFVLLGGQDGWVKTPQMEDQVDMFRGGAYMKLPLRDEAVKKEFPVEMRLGPE